jgi:predicted nucleic acid-binding protein
MSHKMLYLDSSVLVSLALSDPKQSKRASELMHEHGQIVTSELAVVECQAGISAQLAASKAMHQAASAEQNLNRLLATLDLIAVSSLVLGQARSLVKRYRITVGLRSLDAIHIATANLLAQSFNDDSGFRFRYLTADRRQHEAFTAEGLIGDLL